MRDLASRMADLGTETAFDVLARARALEAEGRRVLHLEIGEPDFPTPPHVVEAGVRALRDGHTKYGPPPGLPALREAICERMLEERGVRSTPDEVVVTPGAKPILFLALLATVGPGDEVLVPDPGFPIYESVVQFAGARVVPVPVREESGFSFDVDAAERLLTPQTGPGRLRAGQDPGRPLRHPARRVLCVPGRTRGAGLRERPGVPPPRGARRSNALGHRLRPGRRRAPPHLLRQRAGGAHRGATANPGCRRADVSERFERRSEAGRLCLGSSRHNLPGGGARMRALLAAALLLCACAHGKDDRTICPEYRGQRCLGAQTCALDKQRGCEV